MRVFTLLTGLVVLVLVISGLPTANACSAFYAWSNGRAMAGNNEDYWDCDTRMWFVPAGSDSGRYGRVYFGYSNMFPQGGMNEQGLFFDGFATGYMEVTKSKGKEKYKDNLIDKAMADCGTVAEVIELFEKYNMEFLSNAMLMFGDKYGDSVIIEGDDFVKKSKWYQVVTNFYQSKSDPKDYTCGRYRIACNMLEQESEISVDLCKKVLAATHNEQVAPTQYSNVYDLNLGIVYLYHFHNFENEVVINLAEELKKGEHVVDIPTLFPETYAASVFKQQRRQEMDKKRESLRLKDFDFEILDDYAGIYAMNFENYPVMDVKVGREGDKFYVYYEEEKYELIPVGKDHFAYIAAEGESEYLFVRDDKGKVVKLDYKVMGKTYSGRRK